VLFSRLDFCKKRGQTAFYLDVMDLVAVFAVFALFVIVLSLLCFCVLPFSSVNKYLYKKQFCVFVVCTLYISDAARI